MVAKALVRCSGLRRIDAETQARLGELMSKNTEGALDAAERHEFERLGRTVERLSLENARLLAGGATPTATMPEKPARSSEGLPKTRRRISPKPKIGR